MGARGDTAWLGEVLAAWHSSGERLRWCTVAVASGVELGRARAVLRRLGHAAAWNEEDSAIGARRRRVRSTAWGKLGYMRVPLVLETETEIRNLMPHKIY